MLKKKYFICLVLIGFSIALAALAFAQCPEGKSEIQLTTPKGIQKTICIPDNALPGVENAAEHSDGTIIPSSCPCWDEADLKYYLENKMLEYCHYDTDTHILSCYDTEKLVILEAGKEKQYCINYVTQDKYALNDEQWNTCYKLTEGFLK